MIACSYIIKIKRKTFDVANMLRRCHRAVYVQKKNLLSRLRLDGSTDITILHDIVLHVIRDNQIC